MGRTSPLADRAEEFRNAQTFESLLREILLNSSEDIQVAWDFMQTLDIPEKNKRGFLCVDGLLPDIEGKRAHWKPTRYGKVLHFWYYDADDPGEGWWNDHWNSLCAVAGHFDLQGELVPSDSTTKCAACNRRYKVIVGEEE